QLLPESGVVCGRVRHHLADKFGRAVVGQKALGRVPKHLLFFRKSEIQLAFLRFVDGESCGLKPLRSMFSGTIKAFERASAGNVELRAVDLLDSRAGTATMVTGSLKRMEH